MSKKNSSSNSVLLELFFKISEFVGSFILFWLLEIGIFA